MGRFEALPLTPRPSKVKFNVRHISMSDIYLLEMCRFKNISIFELYGDAIYENRIRTRKENLQANSRSA